MRTVPQPTEPPRQAVRCGLSGQLLNLVALYASVGVSVHIGMAQNYPLTAGAPLWGGAQNLIDFQDAQSVASPARGHVGTGPPPLAFERIFALGYIS